jgi:hypothetical protein
VEPRRNSLSHDLHDLADAFLGIAAGHEMEIARRVGLRRSGSMDTITSAELSLRKDGGVNA